MSSCREIPFFHLVRAEIDDLNIGETEFLDVGDLVVVEAKDLEVGEPL